MIYYLNFFHNFRNINKINIKINIKNKKNKKKLLLLLKYKII